MAHPRAMDPYQVLGIKESSLRCRGDLEQLRQRSKELFKRYASQKREPDAKRVSAAFETIKHRFERSGGAEKRRPEAKEPKKKAVAPAVTTAAKLAKRASSRGAIGSGSAAKVPRRHVVPAGCDTPLPGASRRAVHAEPMQGPGPAPAARAVGMSRVAVAMPKALLRCPCGEVCISERVLKRTVSAVGDFTCPACIVRKMDPFSLVLEGSAGILRLALIQPPLVPKSARQEATFRLKLNLPRLQVWRKKGHNIEVRMCCLDNFVPRHVWPKSMTFNINNKPGFNIDPPAGGHKRRDVPKQISADLHSGLNVIEITVKDDYVQRFALAILRTQPQVPLQLCKRVSCKSEEDSRQQIAELLFSSILEGSGSEVQCAGAADQSRLVCPITFSRIRTPVRGVKCRHVQCFDLSGFITSNWRMGAFNNRWGCPVCDLPLRPPGDLFIDMYHMRVLSETGDDAEEVTFDQAGGWNVTATASSPAPESDSEGHIGAGEEVREALADESEARADECKTPADEGEDSAEDCEPHADEGEASADGCEARADEGEASADDCGAVEVGCEAGEGQCEVIAVEGEAGEDQSEAGEDQCEAGEDQCDGEVSEAGEDQCDGEVSEAQSEATGDPCEAGEDPCEAGEDERLEAEDSEEDIEPVTVDPYLEIDEMV